MTAPAVEVWVGIESFLGQIREQLRSRAFQPVEARRVLIPQANGKMRTLGIPTIADRHATAGPRRAGNSFGWNIYLQFSLHDIAGERWVPPVNG